MGGHYIPKPRYRSDDASRYAHRFFTALQPWRATVTAEAKRHHLAGPTPAFLARDADNLLCDCAAALAESVEWEGALLAHHLALRGWPIDRHLVAACQQFSSGVMDSIMDAVRAGNT